MKTELQRYLRLTLGFSEASVNEIGQQISASQHHGFWLKDQLLMEPRPSVKGNLTNLQLRWGEEKYHLSVETCRLVLAEENEPLFDVLEPTTLVWDLGLHVHELHVVALDTASLYSIYQALTRLHFLAHQAFIQELVVWNTRGELEARAFHVNRRGHEWQCDFVYLFDETVKLEHIQGNGANFMIQTLYSLPRGCGWQLGEPVHGVRCTQTDRGLDIQWKSHAKLVQSQDETPAKWKCPQKLRHLNLRGSMMSMDFGDFQVYFKNLNLEDDSYEMDELIRWECEVLSIPKYMELHNLCFSGSIVDDGSSILLFQLNIKNMQLTAKQATEEWLDSLKPKLSPLDRIHTPYAKVNNYKCFLTMSAIDQVTSGLPLASIPRNEFDFETSLGDVARMYISRLADIVARRKEIAGQIQSSLSDSVAASVGVMALHVSAATPLGIAASMAAVGAKDGLSAAANAGKCSRGAGERDSYKFGDVTRGVAASFRQPKSTNITQVNENSENSEADKSEKAYLEKNKGRYAKVAGSSVGAAMGLALIGGPVGFLAGSLVGGSAAKKIADSGEANDDASPREGNQEFEAVPSISAIGSHASGNSEPCTIVCESLAGESSTLSDTEGQRGYRFGDLSRSVVARGKRAAGRPEDSSYKFGDFTRGLFSSS
jgi:hypothetical protein